MYKYKNRSTVKKGMKRFVLFAVPAEEMIEIDYRNKLREQGKLKYMGGKQQLIYEGAFDDIDSLSVLDS